MVNIFNRNFKKMDFFKILEEKEFSYDSQNERKYKANSDETAEYVKVCPGNTEF